MSRNATIAELAERLGRRRSTIERWIGKGVIVQGRTVRLAAERLGGRFEVSEEALAAFRAACNPNPTPVPETPAASARRLQAGKAEALKLLG